ncbi:MAG TPA: transglycosylase SLT domain-containing protein [Candidatus Binatia bacterium]|nr:transglycosylase SLT domain-containing protein [Candidatus Binatia bacterium]
MEKTAAGVGRSRSIGLTVGVFVLALAAVPAVYSRGLNQGQAAQVGVGRERLDMEQKITAVIVERNPQATIREFGDFPRALLDVAEASGLDFRILLAMADKESGFRPDAVGRAGEIGLMQILPATAEMVVKRLGLEYTPPGPARNGTYASLGSLADPRFNVRVGAEYLRWQIDRFGLNATALRAYNRNPDKATEHRPLDRYAEDVSIRYLVLAQSLR